MHTATHLVVLATLASLAHAVSLRGVEVSTMPLTVKCCVASKVLPPAFKNDMPACAAPHSDPKKDPAEFALEAENSCLFECIVNENGLLNADKSIKEKEFRAHLMEKSDPSIRTLLQGAMDKCFKGHNENPDNTVCKSGVQGLVGCIQFELLSNCPVTMWNKDKKECKEKMGITADDTESKEKENSATDDAESKEKPKSATDDAESKEKPKSATDDAESKEKPKSATDDAESKEKPKSATDDAESKEKPKSATEDAKSD